MVVRGKSVLAVMVLGVLLAEGAVAEGAGHMEQPFVFAPLRDDGWRSTADEIAKRLPWADPIVPGYRVFVSPEDDTVDVKHTLGTSERHSLVLPVQEKAHRTYGVHPGDLPPLLLFEPAWHYMGMTSSTRVATVTAIDGSGAFASLGSEVEGVLAVAAAMGVQVGDTPQGYEISKEKLRESDWRKQVEFRSPPEGLRVFYGSSGDVVIRCTCTIVTIDAPPLGETVNRLTGIYDETGQVFLVKTTPWVDPQLLDFGDVKDMEDAALRYVNETHGHPIENLKVEFQTYGLRPTSDNLLAFAGFVSIEARTGFLQSTFITVPVDPETLTAYRWRGPIESVSLPAVPPLLPVVGLLLCIAVLMPRGARRQGDDG